MTKGKPNQTSAFTVGNLLSAKIDAELSSRTEDWPDFRASVLERIAQKEADDGAVLRTDEVSPQEQADAPLIDTAHPQIGGISIQAVLKEATDAALEAVDFGQFAQDIELGLRTETMAEAIGNRLRADIAKEVSSREEDWAEFIDDVMVGLDVETHQAQVASWLQRDVNEALALREHQWSELSEGVQVRLSLEALEVGDRLREASETELESQASAWTAFSAQVMDRISADSVVEAHMSPEDRAISLFKAEVEAEVEARALQFERGFQTEVERRIRQASEPQRVSWWQRFQQWLVPESSVGWSLMATAAAAAVVVYVGVSSETGSDSFPSGPTGQVAVERVSFEGSVTVIPDDGVTVVWLSDA